MDQLCNLAYKLSQVLTADERHTVACALHLAAEQYDTDVKTCHASGDARTAQQFESQAAKARELEFSFEL